MKHAEPAQHLTLAVRLHRAEELLGTLRKRLERLGVHRVEVAELRLEHVGVELVRGHVLGGELDQPLAHPGHGPLRGVHDLVERDVEAEVGARE